LRRLGDLSFYPLAAAILHIRAFTFELLTFYIWSTVIRNDTSSTSLIERAGGTFSVSAA
jgi:hypothetical protein